MKSIKHALTERYYTWEDARELAEEDPEVDLANVTNPYNPSTYFADEVASSEPAAVDQAHLDPSVASKASEGAVARP